MLAVWCTPVLQRLYQQYGVSGGAFELGQIGEPNALPVGSTYYPFPGYSALEEGTWTNAIVGQTGLGVDASPEGITAVSSDTTSSTSCGATPSVPSAVGGCYSLAGNWVFGTIFYVQSPSGGSFRWRANDGFGVGAWTTVNTAGTAGINFLNFESPHGISNGGIFTTLQINVLPATSGPVTLTVVDLRSETPGIHAIMLGQPGGTSQEITNLPAPGFIRHMQNLQPDVYMSSWGGNEGGASLSPGMNIAPLPSGTNPQTTLGTFGSGLSAVCSGSTITPTGWTLSNNDIGAIITVASGCTAGTYYVISYTGGVWTVIDNVTGAGHPTTPGTGTGMVGTISAGMTGFLSTLNARVAQANPNVDLMFLPEYDLSPALAHAVSDYQYELAEETWARLAACNPSSGVGCAILKASLLVGGYPQSQQRGLLTNPSHLGAAGASMWAGAIVNFLDLGDPLPYSQSNIAAAISTNSVGGGAFAPNLQGVQNILFGPGSGANYNNANQNIIISYEGQQSGNPSAIGNTIIAIQGAKNAHINYATLAGWDACSTCVGTGENAFFAGWGDRVFPVANTTLGAQYLAGIGSQPGSSVVAGHDIGLIGGNLAGGGTNPLINDFHVMSMGGYTGKCASGPTLAYVGSWGDGSCVRHNNSYVTGRLIAGTTADVSYSATPVLANTTAYTLNTDESGGLCTNPGAAGTVICTLPACSVTAIGLTYAAYEATPTASSFTLELLAGAGDKISLGATTGAAAGNIQTITFGSAAKLVCIATNNWAAVSFNGTWTVN
jgi:hypothetical protein